MGKIIFIIFLFSGIGIYACEGNCVACHPKLIKKNGKMDKNHEILTTCKKCHTKKSLSKVNMGATSCGQDCWQCHDMKKVAKTNIKEHKVLNTCIKCHTAKDKNIFKFDNSKQYSGKNLIDIIN